MAISEELKKNYWSIIRRTRSSGRIAQSVIDKTEEKWQKYDESVIRKALELHISQYPSYKENYTLGIMRNLQRDKDSNREVRKNQFQQFEQRGDIDFEALEQELLANQINR